MGKTADELRNDLEKQRDVLSQDLVAIGDRVSPGRMVERRRSAVRQSLNRARDAVMGARDSAASTTRQGFSSTAEGIGSATSSVQSTAGSAVSTVGGVVTSAPQAIQTQTQGNPMAAGIIAFGVGALAGTLLPTTRREEQAVAQVQPALESAATELAQGAQGIADTAKDHVSEATEHLKASAAESAQAVKAEAQDAVQSVKSEAQDAADETRRQPGGTIGTA